MTTILKTYRCASIDIGVLNLAFCVMEFTEVADGTFGFDLVHIERARIGSTNETIHRLGKKLVNFYADNEALKGQVFDFIFIEQQLSRAVKNYVLAYVTMTYFETINLEQTVSSTKVVFVSPKNKFKAVRHTFSKQLLNSIDFERQGRELKKLSVEIAKLLFGSFGVEVGLYALRDYKTKLDDVSDVFLQSFAFFLDKKNSSDTGRSWFIGGKEDGECEDTDEQTEKMAIVTIDS